MKEQSENAKKLSKNLQILMNVTKPMSPEQVKEFLIARHGSVEYCNASADKSVFDEKT